MNNSKTKIQMTTMLNGMMSYGKMDEGLNILDFVATDMAEVVPFVANCKVQAMRDGNVYITELPKRQRRRPLFREDNSSLSKGKDGRFYFVFTMPGDRVEELPERLMAQARAIAKKVADEYHLEEVE